MKPDRYFTSLAKRHAAEGKFARVKHDVPAGVGLALIKPGDGTVFVSRNGLPVPLQNTESGLEILNLDRRDRARFVLAVHEVILEERERALDARAVKYDPYVLVKAIQRLLKARIDWNLEEIVGLAQACAAFQEAVSLDLPAAIFGHIRRYDLLAGEGGRRIRDAARLLDQALESRLFDQSPKFKKLRALLTELAGQAEVIDLAAVRKEEA